MSQFIIGIDIGGTTYSSTLFDEKLNPIKNSDKDLIENFNSTDHLLDAISNQINSLINKNLIGNILGVGISCPGPLDSKKGIILDTPNLDLLQNVKLKTKLEQRCKIPVIIENDANAFALGEWFVSKSKDKVFGAITLGTGLGFGIVINGDIYTGAHGLAAEYAISPMESGNWETKVSIRAIKELAKKHIKKDLEPLDIFEMAVNGDPKAINVWDDFGENLGLVLSHFINMIDPDKISIGGGISGAFKFFESKMKESISTHCPAYNNFKIDIFESKKNELSSQIGAALLVKNSKLIL